MLSRALSRERGFRFATKSLSPNIISMPIHSMIHLNLIIIIIIQRVGVFWEHNPFKMGSAPKLLSAIHH